MVDAVLVGALAVLLDPAPMRRLVAELAAASARDPALRSEVTRLWAARRAATADVLRRAAERGDLRCDVDPAVLVDQLAGALYYRVLVTGDPLDVCYAATLVDAALRGARPHRRNP